MEVGADIARIIIESRSANIVADEKNLVDIAIKEAEHLLSVENPITINTLLVHEECYRAGVQCSNAMPVEYWTISLTSDRRIEKISKALNPLFLMNAVRSQLHFSQLNSWITNNGGTLPNGLVFVYRLACEFANGVIGESDISESTCENLKESHIFPTAKCGSYLLAVSVRWRKFHSPPLLPCCLLYERNRCQGRDWVSPMDPISSNSSFASLNEAARDFISKPVTEKSEFGIDEDEDSSGVYSASISSHEPSLFRYGSSQSLNEADPTVMSDIPPSIQRQLSLRKNRQHDLSNASERPSKKRNFLETDIAGSINLNSPTMLFLDQLEKYATAAKVAKSGEVEVLADALAESSPLTNKEQPMDSAFVSRRQSVPRRCLLSAFRFMSGSSTIFSKKTGLPLNSSPAPFGRREKAVKSHSFSNSVVGEDESSASDNEKLCSVKAVSSSSGLLCNFEESVLNGRLEPLGSVDGFRLQLSASGLFCSPHINLPVEAFVFNLSEDNAPSPYFGRCSLESLGRKGYHIPNKGVIQATLFNPQGTVICLFVVRFDVSEMPPSCQTFLRQRQFFMPLRNTSDGVSGSWLRYLIHLRLATDRRCRLYVHSDIRMLFSQKSDLEGLNVELEKEEQRFDLRTFTEMPQKPRFSPRK